MAWKGATVAREKLLKPGATLKEFNEQCAASSDHEMPYSTPSAERR